MTKPKKEVEVYVPQDLIKELLTKSEWRMVKQRLLIIKLLEEGLSVRTVASQIGVGTDTVIRVSRKLENSTILRRAFEKFSASGSRWIIGSAEED